MAEAELTDEQLKTVEKLAVQCLKSGIPLSVVKGYSTEELEAVYNVTYNLYQQQKYEDAKTLFQFLTLHEPAEGRFWLGLAACYHRLAEHESAINAYSCAALVDATNPIYAFHAGECYLAMEDWENAKKAIEAVTTLCEVTADEEDHTELLKRTETMSQIVNGKLRT